MVRVLFASLVALAAIAANAQSSGALVALDDGNFVVASGSSVCNRYSTAEKIGTAIIGLGYGYGGETFDSAALGLESITAEGQPNLQFGRKGLVVTPLLPAKNHDGAFATALVRDARGRLIAVGWRTQSTWLDSGLIFITAARYDASGALDPSFGENGLVNVRRAADCVTAPMSAVIDARGRLVIAGYNGGRRLHTKLGSFDDYVNHLFVARFTTDGRPDRSFGDHGFALTDIIPEPVEVKVNPNCKQEYNTCLWLAREKLKATERNYLVYVHAPAGLAIDARNRIVAGASASDGTFILTRFLDDGKIDTTFGNGGMTRTRLPPDSTIASIVIDRSGRLRVVGSKGERIALARYTADGIPEGDVRETPFADGLVPSAAVFAPDGNLFVAAAGQATLAVGLFDANGSPVKSFGRDGIMSSETARSEGPAGLTVNAAGEPTVAAWSEHGVAVLFARRTTTTLLSPPTERLPPLGRNVSLRCAHCAFLQPRLSGCRD